MYKWKSYEQGFQVTRKDHVKLMDDWRKLKMYLLLKTATKRATQQAMNNLFSQPTTTVGLAELVSLADSKPHNRLNPYPTHQ